MSEHGSIRNLEQIQEDDDERRMPRSVSVTLLVLGGGCILFAGLALGGRTSQPQVKKSDPLGELAVRRNSASSAAPGARPPTELLPRDVTFPQMLSDEDKPPTALAAVRSSGLPTEASASAPTQPPPATDRLSVVPLPAQAVLEATPIVTRPRDKLTKVATDAAQMGVAPHDEGPAGHEGGYQLQVSSFRTQGDAQGFADQLRAREHKAYVVEARVPGRGTWFRVRVGPFPTQHAATQYRTMFEAREHVVPFIVPPETTARAAH
jgi:DedD protein